MADTLTITDNRTGKTYELPITDGAIKATDLKKIKTADPDDTGLLTYDPAFMNTAACRSRITYIDGDKGILLYRGYPIEQLAEHSTYLETAYLILNGELPIDRRPCRSGRTRSRCTRWSTRTSRSSWRASPTTPIPWACSSAPSPRCRRSTRTASRSSTPSARKMQIQRLIAKTPTIAAYAYPPQHRPPVRLPRQRPQLHRQLPEHAVQDDRGEVQAEREAGARARRPLHPARRPRAELLDQHDAQHRQLARGPVLGAGRRGRGALRPAARRRQRSRAADAERDRLGRPTSPTSSSGSRPATAA